MPIYVYLLARRAGSSAHQAAAAAAAATVVLGCHAFFLLGILSSLFQRTVFPFYE